ELPSRTAAADVSWILAAGQVFGDGIAPAITAGNPKQQIAGIGQRTGDAAPGEQRVVVAVLDRKIGGEGFGGATGDYTDRTRGGIAAEDRALRSFQHLDALDVEEI